MGTSVAIQYPNQTSPNRAAQPLDTCAVGSAEVLARTAAPVGGGPVSVTCHSSRPVRRPQSGVERLPQSTVQVHCQEPDFMPFTSVNTAAVGIAILRGASARDVATPRAMAARSQGDTHRI
jgi:hypothetical protein